MNDWYALTNDLETTQTSLDELTLARIREQALSRLPKRRVRLKIALIAAVLVLLTACGVAALRYADWFGTLANPAAPAETEDLLASIGTAIDRSQTVDGITVTLHGALYDGSTFLLSLSVEGLEEENRYSSRVDPGTSWLFYSRVDCERHWNEVYPEEADRFLAQYDQMATSMTGSVIMTRQFDMDRCLLLVKPNLMPQEGRELVLHLEDLEVLGQTVEGPFDFTFTPERKDASQSRNGSARLTAKSGEPFEITQIVITPLEVQVYIRGEGQPPERTPTIEELRLAETAETWSLRSGSRLGSNADGTWDGCLTYGTLERVLNPDAVTAVRIDDTWVELADFTAAE